MTCRAGGSLRGRLVLSMTLVAALAAAVTGVVALSLVRLAAEQDAERLLREQAGRIAASERAVAGGPARLCTTRNALRVAGTELYLVRPGGRVAVPPCGHRSRPAAPPPPPAALAGALTAGGVTSGVAQGLAWAAAPFDVVSPGRSEGVLLVRRVRGLGARLARLLAWRLLAAAGVAAGLAVAVALWQSRRLTAPLRLLVGAARRLGAGDLGARVNISTDDEVAEVARAFNDMAAALQQAQEEQRDFLASVGHELRTPLTAVQGYTEALLDGTVEDPAQRREALERVHAETLRLGRLVEDLQVLARLGRGRFTADLVDADAAAVAREAAQAAAARAAGREVPVVARVDGPLPARTDPGRLRQVLDNLLENATRSSPAGSPVLLEGRARPDGRVELAVTDRGPGIAEADLPRAFDRGYLWSRYRGTRAVGSGLGLAIVKGLCDAMGATVSAERAPGGGTTFRVLLPPPLDTAASN